MYSRVELLNAEFFVGIVSVEFVSVIYIVGCAVSTSMSAEG
jgi:hypothetical protein